jgi:hypothetical protein
MRIRLLAVLGVYVLSAQTPNFNGAWKVNFEKSKMGGPPPSLALTIVDQKGSKLVENILIVGPRGEELSSITYDSASHEFDEWPADAHQGILGLTARWYRNRKSPARDL